MGYFDLVVRYDFTKDVRANEAKEIEVSGESSLPTR